MARLTYKGAVVEVPDEKVDRLLSSGFAREETAAKKTTKRSTAKADDSTGD